MAVIGTGLMPKAIGGASMGPPTRSVGPQQPSVLSLAPVLRRAGARRLAGQIGGANALAAHNCGGTAHHDGGSCAYPVGRR